MMMLMMMMMMQSPHIKILNGVGSGLNTVESPKSDHERPPKMQFSGRLIRELNCMRSFSRSPGTSTF